MTLYGVREEARTPDRRLMVLYARLELTPTPNFYLKIRNYATYINIAKAATLPTELHEHLLQDVFFTLSIPKDFRAVGVEPTIFLINRNDLTI